MRRLSAYGVEASRRAARDLAGATAWASRKWRDTFWWLLPAAEHQIRYPPAPSGTIFYVVGDIHGRDDLLEELCGHIDDDLKSERGNEAIEIYLGDYVDRGPESARVINRLLDRRSRRKTIFLRGNHDRVLERFLQGEPSLEDWRQVGGFETLLSYGVQPDMLRDLPDQVSVRRALADRLPDSHRVFLAELRPHYSAGAYFFVHAGVRPGVPLEQQAESDYLWIRDDFLDHSGSFGRIVVHGHTPVMQPELLPNRINLDTGAYATGVLSCLKISGDGARIFGSGSE
jgi:serine/threonine protein phosphatase 1